ncbi:MAG: LPS export ABC transporter permease LptG [Pontibacterium sp.]
MNRLDRYVSRHVLSAIVIVILVIVGLSVLIAVVDQMPDLNTGYQFSNALYYVGMTVPRRLYDHMPLCALIGCLMGLGALASSSELTVMRAAGVSTLRIISSVLKPVMLVVVVQMILGEYVVPRAELAAQSYRTLAVAEGRNGRSGLDHGFWHREGRTFLYVQAVGTNDDIYGVTRYQFDENWLLKRSDFAKKGTYTGDGWLLETIRGTRFLGDRTVEVQEDEEYWRSGMTPALLATLIMPPSRLSISGLYAYSNYLEQQGLSAAEYEVAFWSKMLQPLSLTGLMLVAVSFIFGPLRSVTVGQRLIAGVLVGVSFKLIQDVLGPASTVYDLPPLIGVLLPILAGYLIGWRLMSRAG